MPEPRCPTDWTDKNKPCPNTSDGTHYCKKSMWHSVIHECKCGAKRSALR